MGSINKITEVIAAIKTIYPYYAKDADVQTLVKTWNVLLKDYSDNDITTALYMCLQTCKMPPTPADLIERLASLKTSLEPSDEELWNELTAALRKADRYISRFAGTFIEGNGLTQGQNARNDFDKLWEGLPEKIRMYLGGRGEFLRLARNNDDEEIKFERNRFLKTMPTIQKRYEYKQTYLAIDSGTGAVGQLTEGGR